MLIPRVCAGWQVDLFVTLADLYVGKELKVSEAHYFLRVPVSLILRHLVTVRRLLWHYGIRCRA